MSQINEGAIATPGVYVTEIPSFPPSIAQVATAIPAFVGYTANATNLQPGDLLLVPTRLSSMVEYQSYFGNAPDPGITQVDIDANNTVTTVKRSATYYMYDSIRMFFLNGGGACYIVSIGLFQTTPNAADFTNGLAALSKYDEPTLILFPDAALLNRPDFATVQSAGLAQCGLLQDRFCILDMQENLGWTNGRDNLRTDIGVKNLNYGAVYTPFLQTSLGLSVVYSNLKGKVYQAGVPIDFKSTSFTTVPAVQNLVISYNNLIADTATLNSGIASLVTAPGDLDIEEEWLTTLNTYMTSFVVGPPVADNELDFEKIFNFIYSIAAVIDSWVHNIVGDSGGAGLKADLAGIMTTSFIPSMSTLLSYDIGAEHEFGAGKYYDNRTAYLANNFHNAYWGTAFTAPTANTAIYGTQVPAPAGSEPSYRMTAIPALTNLFNQFNQGITQLSNLTATYQASYEQSLLLQLPVYKQIVTAVEGTTLTLPPSGAIAGVYASTDATRGVWKAPANVSLAGVPSLTYNIDDGDQGLLNIDPMTGKSINAIRAFTGKGILVWGARTLDGNSNDFRYISVRRLLIMIEESVKLAAMQFVFEPNDGNTWVRISAMIGNYLTNLWRQGALAGSKPEQSFYVKVGLGQTMIFDDILNGKMIIEVGLAPVRPAEFIIIRFSQIQQTS